MAGSVASTPTYALQPANQQVTLPSNYMAPGSFDFTNQYLPDTEAAQAARYGNRTIAGMLYQTGAESPFVSDVVTWGEQGRLHTKYINCTSGSAVNSDTATITVSDTLDPAGDGSIAVRVGDVVYIYANDGTGYNKATVTAVDLANGDFDVAYFVGTGQSFAIAVVCSVFITHSEWKKGTEGPTGSMESYPEIYNNTPLIIRDKYVVSGSDMAQIGWLQVLNEDGTSGGFFWHLQSTSDTMVRYNDKLEMAGLEAIPAEASSGVIAIAASSEVGNKGSEGVFYVVEERGNVYSGGVPSTLADFDSQIDRLDKQGAISQNALYVDRRMSLAYDDMLAQQNSYGVGGTSWGAFNNSSEMGLNLGFRDFRRGSYDFYKSDWKYLNDITTRGGMPNTSGSGRIYGMMIPMGSTNVYDQNMGAQMTRPFLHVRYRQSATEGRRYKSWVTGSAGGASTSTLDAMEISFLSERMLCTVGANNFFIYTA